jgi:hypothetical protein
MLVSTTYPKSNQEHVWILQKHRYRYFKFHFFKQKPKLKSIYMLWGSCSSGHTEHNKIGFAIFGVLCDLKWNLQGPLKAHKKGKIHFAQGPQELSKLHNSTLSFNAQAPTRLRPSHTYPQRWGWARRRRGRARAGKQVAQGRDSSHPWPIGGGCWTGDVAGERRRWSSGGTAAGAPIPVRAEAMLMNVWHG